MTAEGSSAGVDAWRASIPNAVWLDGLVEQLRGIPNVTAVALGGSRATGTHTAESDWDFGLYYRGSIDVARIRSLGHAGVVVEPGEWGRLVNGGAWLTVDGTRVDLLYRDLEVVEHWTSEADAGRYERDHVEGFVAGMPTYVLAGELALCRVVSGELPRPTYPAALQSSAPARWFSSARFSLDNASAFLARGDRPGAIALAMKGVIAAAQGVLARRGEWALNEKRIIGRAALEEMAADVLGAQDDLADVLNRCRESVDALGAEKIEVAGG